MNRLNHELRRLLASDKNQCRNEMSLDGSMLARLRTVDYCLSQLYEPCAHQVDRQIKLWALCYQH